MRALLLTVGSRGDVQPFVALGSRLRAEWHDAVLAAPAMFGDLAAAHSVPFVPLDLDMSEVGAVLAGRHGLRHLVAFCQSMGRRAAAVLPGATEAAMGADIVVHHPVLPIGQHLAELLGVPAVVAQPIPGAGADRRVHLGGVAVPGAPDPEPAVLCRGQAARGPVVPARHRPVAAGGAGAAAAALPARPAAGRRWRAGYRTALIQRPRAAPAFGPPTRGHLDALRPGWHENAFTRCLYRSMVFLAGSSHRERRQAAARPFVPRQIGTFRTELGEIAGMLVDRLAAHRSRPVDLVEHLALPFASLSLGRLLAIPDDEAVRLGRLARRVGPVFEQFATAEQHRIVGQGDNLTPRAVAEILRYEPPVQLVVRAALEAAELSRTPIPAGSMVFGLIAAANRDPAQVKEPDAFDVTREQVPSLSFGAGRITASAPTWPACRARCFSRGCCAGSPACARPASPSTARPARRCAAWTACRCNWHRKP